MKKIVSLAVAMAVATVCASASASPTVVTFEGYAPGIYSGGDQIHDGDTVITAQGLNGFDGAIIDGTDPNRCDVAVCPAGSTYYGVLNDGGVSLGFSGNLFNLTGVDFAFILPAPTRLDLPVGQLIVTGSDGSVVRQDFGLQDSNGQYGFAHWNFDGAFAQSRFSSVTFNACVYDDSRTCQNPAGNQAQFGIDNISAAVPEPGSLPLVALSLMGMMAAYRRRKSA